MSAVRATRPSSISAVRTAIINCERCPRLREYCREIGRTKKAAFRNDVYWARPVPGFGDPGARMLILGLAPAAHGANRTGRVFTGDGVGASGDFLMAALKRAGFANISTSQRPDDGLELKDAYIISAVRCAPPDNKPLPEEIDRCLPHLIDELEHLPNLQVVVALGKIAWDAWLKVSAQRGVQIPRPRPTFAHGAIVDLSPDDKSEIANSSLRNLSSGDKSKRRDVSPTNLSPGDKSFPRLLVGAYHPSRQNTNTGLLTPKMYDAVFRKVRQSLR